ncbi:MBL fold metallo-hydrolase [bacterium]|nr:MBL fold metallo-hydrolase [bacterium]
MRAVLPGLLLLVACSMASAGVSITVLDVGQGDATLIRSTSGQTLLFDGGPNGQGSGTILPYLAGQDIQSLDYIVASHYHADHIGGLDEVYSHTGASGGVWDRGWTYTTLTYTSYASAVAGNRFTIADGHVFDLGDGVTVTCLGLNGNGQLGQPHDESSLENEYCIALLVECGDFDYFQAGDLIGTDASGHDDIETSIAQDLAAMGKADLEVYKVNHHGSYTSSNAFFLNTTTPEVAVISVGATNPYGHPHDDPMQRLLVRDVFVYQTTPGNGYVLPPSHLDVVGGHVEITTDGFGTYTVDGDTWEMDEQGTTPVLPAAGGLVLLGNAPNPFNPTTSIRLVSARGGAGLLEVFDLAGRRVSRRAFTASPGRTSLTWSGTDRASGVYLYRVTLPEGVREGRMVIAK